MSKKQLPFAIYSGYTMDGATFAKFYNSIPELVRPSEGLGVQRTMWRRYLSYSSWRRRMPTKQQRKRVPLIFLRPTSYPAQYPMQVLMASEPFDAYFFVIRAINFTSDDQFNESHPDYVKHAVEREADRAKLKAFIEFVHSQGGELTPDMVRFESLKDPHPSCNEWLEP